MTWKRGLLFTMDMPDEAIDAFFKAYLEELKKGKRPLNFYVDKALEPRNSHTDIEFEMFLDSGEARGGSRGYTKAVDFSDDELWKKIYYQGDLWFRRDGEKCNIFDGLPFIPSQDKENKE